MSKPYRFTFGEAVGLFLILLGVPGAALGIGTMFSDGQAILGLTAIHWIAWVAGVGVAAAFAVASRNWRALIGVPLIVMVVLTAGMNDPTSLLASGYASSPMEKAYLGIQTMAKYVALAAPAFFGLAIGIPGVLSRFKGAQKTA